MPCHPDRVRRNYDEPEPHAEGAESMVDWLQSHPLAEAVATIEQFPDACAPRNPHYQKNHRSAPGTVRAWFRTMRAAEFARDIDLLTSEWGGHFWLIDREIWPSRWMVFDTQQVVDRETAAHYARPALESVFFVQDGRVVGRIDGIGCARKAPVSPVLRYRHDPLFHAFVTTLRMAISDGSLTPGDVKAAVALACDQLGNRYTFLLRGDPASLSAGRAEKG